MYGAASNGAGGVSAIGSNITGIDVVELEGIPLRDSIVNHRVSSQNILKESAVRDSTVN